MASLAALTCGWAGTEAGDAERDVEFAAGRVAMPRQVEGDDAKAGLCQWRDESRHEGGLA
jgi:hypothetical protein